MSNSAINFCISWISSSENENLLNIITSPVKENSQNNPVGGLAAEFMLVRKETTYNQLVENLTAIAGIAGIAGLNNLLQCYIFNIFLICLIISIISPCDIEKIPKEMKTFVKKVFKEERFRYVIRKNELYQIMSECGISNEEITFGISFLIDRNLIKKLDDSEDFVSTRRFVRGIEISFL